MPEVANQYAGPPVGSPSAANAISPSGTGTAQPLPKGNLQVVPTPGVPKGQLPPVATPGVPKCDPLGPLHNVVSPGPSGSAT